MRSSEVVSLFNHVSEDNESRRFFIVHLVDDVVFVQCQDTRVERLAVPLQVLLAKVLPMPQAMRIEKLHTVLHG